MTKYKIERNIVITHNTFKMEQKEKIAIDLQFKKKSVQFEQAESALSLPSSPIIIGPNWRAIIYLVCCHRHGLTICLPAAIVN